MSGVALEDGVGGEHADGVDGMGVLLGEAHVGVFFGCGEEGLESPSSSSRFINQLQMKWLSIPTDISHVTWG